MATYITNLTDNVNPIKDFTPDMQLNMQIAGALQSKYDQNWNKLNNIYNKAKNSKLSKDFNIERRDQYFKDIETRIQQLAASDLTKIDIGEASSAIFGNLLNDKAIKFDMQQTSAFATEQAIAESLKNCITDACGEAYWDGGVQHVQRSYQRFLDADAEEMYKFPVSKFVREVNVNKKLREYAESKDYKYTRDAISGGYKITTENGADVTLALQSAFFNDLSLDNNIQQYYRVKNENQWESQIDKDIDKHGVSRGDAIKNVIKEGLIEQNKLVLEKQELLKQQHKLNEKKIETEANDKTDAYIVDGKKYSDFNNEKEWYSHVTNYYRNSYDQQYSALESAQAQLDNLEKNSDGEPEGMLQRIISSNMHIQTLTDAREAALFHQSTQSKVTFEADDFALKEIQFKYDSLLQEDEQRHAKDMAKYEHDSKVILEGMKHDNAIKIAKRKGEIGNGDYVVNDTELQKNFKNQDMVKSGVDAMNTNVTKAVDQWQKAAVDFYNSGQTKEEDKITSFEGDNMAKVKKYLKDHPENRPKELDAAQTAISNAREDKKKSKEAFVNGYLNEKGLKEEDISYAENKRIAEVNTEMIYEVFNGDAAAFGKGIEEWTQEQKDAYVKMLNENPEKNKFVNYQMRNVRNAQGVGDNYTQTFSIDDDNDLVYTYKYKNAAGSEREFTVNAFEGINEDYVPSKFVKEVIDLDDTYKSAGGEENNLIKNAFGTTIASDNSAKWNIQNIAFSSGTLNTNITDKDTSPESVRALNVAKAFLAEGVLANGASDDPNWAAKIYKANNLSMRIEHSGDFNYAHFTIGKSGSETNYKVALDGTSTFENIKMQAIQTRNVDEKAFNERERLRKADVGQVWNYSLTTQDSDASGNPYKKHMKITKHADHFLVEQDYNGKPSSGELKLNDPRLMEMLQLIQMEN